ncbi:testis-expressed protein 11-like [Ostrea edulis]|uniref:testis-expressed protein 11-like n=1 Tax=Ostrea edulis TaxID=37623 RepID=UPI0024AE9A1B|nr:testis-expressed protein 11-like [Ostrea edulis]
MNRPNYPVSCDLKSLIRDLCSRESQEDGRWCDLVEKALQLSGKIQLELQQHPNKDIMEQMETIAVNLWNFTVSLKTGRRLSLLSNAKLRQICLKIVEAAVTTTEDHMKIKRKIAMGLKTARAWLDTKEITMAASVLELTDQFVKQLQKLIVEDVNRCGSTDSSDKWKLDVEEDLFKLLCYKAEANLTQDDDSTALELIQIAKEMLVKFPHEGAFLAMLCYNFGVELYQKKKFEQAVVWLKESFEMGKYQTNLDAKNQARTLRLLASVYLEMNEEDHILKALNAVTLANNGFPHPSGLFLYLRILLKTKEPNSVICKAISDIMQQPGISPEVGINTALLLSKNERHDLAVGLMKELIKKHEHSSILGELLMTNFDILLASKEKQLLKEFVEYCIVENNTHRALDPVVRRRFHIEFWALAYTADEEKNYPEALDWYNYSLSLYNREESGDQNLARLQRNRATCYLNLGQMDKATDAINEARKWDPSSINTLFMSFKLALAGSNVEQAKDILKNMCSEVAKLENTEKEVEAQKLICQAAHMAYENHRELTASLALECLANCSTDLTQTLTALRCLIRLKLSQVDQDSTVSIEDIGLLRDIRMAYNKLLQEQEITCKKSPKLSEEASWFMRVAWNLALKCENRPDLMKDLFVLSSQYSSLCPDDEENTLMRKKTCLLMAAAACLQQARTEGQLHKTKETFLGEAIHLIHECKFINQQIQQEMDRDSSLDTRSKDKSDLLMLMYEFEARCKLQDPAVEDVIEVLLKIPNPDPKPFETIAALSMEPPSTHKNITVRAMKIAIRKHLQMPAVDYDRISKLFRGLIQTVLSTASDNTKEEALKYYDDVVDLIDRKAQRDYPETEILWLMVKAWNCGVTFYSSGRNELAEKWCSTGMKFLKHLSPSMQCNYSERMTNTYADILDQIDKSKAKKPKKGLEE